MIGSNESEESKNKLLEKLLWEAQTVVDNQQRDSAISKIVAIMLESRPLCRRFHGEPLKGVYREIYDLARRDLLAYLKQNLINSSLQPKERSLNCSVKIDLAHLSKLPRQFFQQQLNDNNLKKMGLTAQNYPVNSELRTYALTELIRAIKLSGKLCRPHKSKFSASLYTIIYEEALSETFSYVCLNIDLYDPLRGNCKFMNWVNFKLDKSLLKCYSERQKYAQHEVFTFDKLEQIKQPSNAPNLTQILQDFIAQDADKVFTAVHIRNRVDANFKNIALAKFSGLTWEQISQAFDIPISTLSSFYNRWCRRFAPLLKTELQKYFYYN